MIKLTNENTKNAVARCKQLKPKVRFIRERTFAVASANNSNEYTVRFEVIGGEKFGECDCKAGQQGKFPYYHIAAAATANIYRQTVKRQVAAMTAAAAAATAPYLKPSRNGQTESVGRIRIK